ncbi:TonB-dependent receptor [Desulfobaculum senezii]
MTPNSSPHRTASAAPLRALLVTAGLVILSCVPAMAAEQEKTPTVQLEGMTVTATKAERDLKDVPASVSVLTQEDIRRSPANTVGDLLQDIPGVEVFDQSLAGAKRIMMRGESGSRVLILIDGQKISEQKSMDGAALLIGADRIERIEVIKGPASVLYGSEAIGGVVNIITKKGGDRPLQGETSLTYDSSTDGVASYLSLFGSSKGFNYRLSGTWTDHGDRRTADDTLDDSSFMNRDLSAFLSYDWDKVTVGGGYESYWSNINSVTPEDLIDESVLFFNIDVPRWEREKVHAFVEAHDVTEALVRIRVDGFHQNTRKLMKNSIDAREIKAPSIFTDVSNRITTENKQRTTGGTLQTDWTPHEDHYFIVGMEALCDSLDATTDKFTTIQPPMGPSTKIRSEYDYDATMQTTALFVQDEWTLPSDFALTLGARQTWVASELVDTDDPDLEEKDSSESHPVFSAGLIYGGLENIALRTQFSQGYKAPNLQQLYMGTSHGGSTTAPNPDLSPETSNNYEVGARYSDGALMVDVAAFLSEAEDYITTARVPGGLQFDNVDEAETYGVELEASYTYDPWHLTPYAQGTWMKRQFVTDDASTFKTGHPEFSGRIGLRYDRDFTARGMRVYGDLYARGAVEAKDKDLSKNTVEKYAPWETLNLSMGCAFGEERQHFVNVSLNNIFDRKYSMASSSIDEAGMNAVVKIGTSF